MLKSDMTTIYGNMTYEIGRTYKLEDEIIPCKNGYHFCEELSQCLPYYPNRDCNMRFFEIESGESIINCISKYVTNEITLVRELSLNEVFEYIRNNKDKVNWYYISRYQKLSEKFIREFKDKVDWHYISVYQKLSEEFIREFQDKVDWFYISKYQKLSENLIREFQDKVDWFYISVYQTLSEDFIREFEYSVDWVNIGKCQKLSEEFRREFEYKLEG